MGGVDSAMCQADRRSVRRVHGECARKCRERLTSCAVLIDAVGSASPLSFALNSGCAQMMYKLKKAFADMQNALKIHNVSPGTCRDAESRSYRQCRLIPLHQSR
jgi:hypothetical protein